MMRNIRPGRPITHSKILESCIAFEKNHPVDTYRCYDWNVWPLLRIRASYEAVGPQTQGVIGRVFELAKHSGLSWKCLDSYRSWQNRKPLKTIESIDSRCHQAIETPGQDAILLTLSGRRQKLGNCYFEIYSDPLAQLMGRGEVSSLVWERGQAIWPRCHPSAWISPSLAEEVRKLKPLAPLEEPPWYSDYAIFAQELLGRNVSWVETKLSIQSVMKMSLVLEKWLKSTGAKLLISVCWYDAEIMAATLAAKRIGVLSADLQHGLQGENHLAYSGWMASLGTGYETVPDLFITWGEESAKNIHEFNPGFALDCNPVVIGNLWFNKWRDGADLFQSEQLCALHKLVKGRTKLVLLTLQKGFSLPDFVLEVIASAPVEWLFLVRLHPATPARERSVLENTFSQFSQGKVELSLATSLPLYGLLNLVDIHLTGHSTTALEALGFGVPTVTLTKSGADFFREYIGAGVMNAATDARSLLDALMEFESLSRERCKLAAEKVFAPAGAAEKGLGQLMNLAGIEWRPVT